MPTLEKTTVNEPSVQTELEQSVAEGGPARQNTLSTLQDSAGNEAAAHFARSAGDRLPNSKNAAIAKRGLNTVGYPLDAKIQATMENRLGHRLDGVRIHHGGAAEQAAGAMQARAYTVGPNIVFGRGHYAPHTQRGRQLLSHELAHVAQQMSGSLKTDQHLEQEAQQAEQGTSLSFTARSGPRFQLQFSPERSTRLTIILFEGNRAQFVVETSEGNQVSGPGTASRINEGVYRVHYSDAHSMLIITNEDGSEANGQPQFHTSGSAQELNALLVATTSPIPMDVRLGMPEFAILPEHVRQFLFSGSGLSPRTMRQRDRITLQRIANRLSELSESELEAYQARTVGTTTNLHAFEASINRYMAEVHQRRDAVEAREQAKLQLFGLDDVYRLYRQYRSLQSSSTLSAAAGMSRAGATMGIGGTSLGMQPALNRAREELTENLQRFGYNSISDFEQELAQFRTVFRNEAVLIAQDMLDRYEHILHEQQQRYQDVGETRALHRQLQPAREHFQEANRIRDEHAMMPMTPQEMAEQSYWSGQFQLRQRQGRGAVSTLSSAHPVLNNLDDDDLSHEELALADAGGVRQLIRRYIRERRSDIQQTRRNLASNPDLVFELDTLLEVAFREQGIRPGSLYHQVIQDHIRDTQIERTIINLAVAVFAIAAGLLSGGTGTVAVLASAAAFGIGAYQAIEEFQRYERMSAAHGAQLLSDDPSFAWVIVAVVGASIDLAAAGAALRTLRPAVQTFNETGDVVALEQQLARLTQVEERIRQNVLRAAEVEAQARAAWRSVVRPPVALRAVIVPGAEEFGRLVYAVYLSARRAIIGFENFVRTRHATELIGDIARLTPEELTSLKAAYTQAITDMEAVVAHGRSLSMTDEQIHAFMRLRHNQRSMTVEQLLEEMDNWRTLSQRNVPFGFRDAEQFEEFRSTAQSELRRLLRRSDRNAEAFLQGSSITGIAYSRQIPFDAASDFDVAISSRYLLRQAERRGFEVARNPRRIGPLTDEQIRTLGLHRLRDRLSRVIAEEAGDGTTRGRTINFMLFENEDAVRRPIGDAREATRPTRPLRGDDG